MSKTIEMARILRQRSTSAENAFWEAVRGRRFKVLRFQRQHPIRFEMDGRWRSFIADFFCFEHRLVVEIDGGIHEQQKEYDELRTYIINTLGYRVSRFTNEDVESNPEFVLSELGKALNL
ncbi:MAG: endonuclease domain-containing protein [Candidatus Latescibacter sp.]|nr:endonuclease domain-containing protein [Candidatus Latescibacter sp.]